MGKLALPVLLLILAFTGTGLLLGDKIGKDETAPMQGQVAGSAAAAAPQTAGTGPRIVALKGDRRGHFVADAQVNGTFTRVLVDTGASIVVFSDEDARAAGLNPPKSAFTARMMTANGAVMAARVRISEMRLQSIVVRDVEAAVLPAGALKGTLLGMSFLSRLSGFEIQGGTLVLRQ